MDNTKNEIEQQNDVQSEVAADHLIVEIPTEIRAGVAVALAPTSTCGGSYACYSLRAN